MFKAVAKSKRLLMWTLFLIFMLQMPQFALSAGIDTIQKNIFKEYSLSTIQTVMSLPNLLSVAAGILSTVVVSLGFTTKKTLTISGIGLIALTGIVSMILHTQFWQLVLFSVLIGLGLGLFVPSAQSIMLDSFDEKERQLISGLQFSFINLGGIIMSVASGLMITLIWYGGYIMLLIVLPVVIMSIFTLPKMQKLGKSPASGGRVKGSKLPVEAYFYIGTLFLFTLMFSVTMSNLPTHLQSNHLGNAGTAGIVIATTMAGGVCAGIFFDKLSGKIKDYVLPLSMGILFLGFTILNIFSASLPAIFIGAFLAGTTTSLCIAQCIFATSNLLDSSNSALAATFLSCIAPGFGGFLSPVVFTNITQALVPDATGFRYQFVGIVALILGVLLFLKTYIGERRAQAVLQPAE